MRKISEIRGEDALDILADLIEPVSVIFIDEAFVQAIRENRKIDAVKVVLRNHKKEILTVLAILNGVEPESYNPSLAELPVLVINLLNDPDLAEVFSSADSGTNSGSATENIEVIGQG